MQQYHPHTSYPSKRPRLYTDDLARVREISTSIQQAVTTRHRLEAIHRMFSLLHYDDKSRSCHGDPSVFNMMLQEGILDAIALQLGYLLHRHGSSSQELHTICTAMDLFHRYCPEVISEEKMRERGEDFFATLQVAFERGYHLSILSIWHSISGSHLGTNRLMRNSTMIQSVGIFLQKKSWQDCEKLELLGLLKNVTYYGEEYRHLFVEQPGFLSLITALVESNSKTQELVSAILRNLVLSPDTRQVMAQRPDVLSGLAHLASTESRHTLRNVVHALMSIATDECSCLLIFFHGDGTLLQVLKGFVQFDDDPVVRKRAIRTLKFMARESSAQMLVNDNQLMESLTNRALYDTDPDIRFEATEAFAKFSTMVKAPMVHHDAILDALTQLASNPNTRPEVVAKALKDQTVHQENRKAMVDRQLLMAALAKIGSSADSSNRAKENVCSAILNLSKENCNLGSLATKHTLQALVRNAEVQTTGPTAVNGYAIRALLNLSKDPANRKMMAGQPSLLQHLIQHTASAQDNQMKEKLKGAILALATEL